VKRSESRGESEQAEMGRLKTVKIANVNMNCTGGYPFETDVVKTVNFDSVRPIQSFAKKKAR